MAGDRFSSPPPTGAVPDGAPATTLNTEVLISLVPHPSGRAVVLLRLQAGDLSMAYLLAGADAIGIARNLEAAGRQAASGLVVAAEVPNGHGGPLR